MIDLSQSELAILLLRSLLSGALLGVAYDILRAFKMLLGVEYGSSGTDECGAKSVFIFIITFVTDLLFFTGAGCFAIFLAYAGGGFFRGMILLGMAIGFLLYYFTLGRAVLALNSKIIALLKKVLRKLKPHIIKPLKLILGRIIFFYHLTIGRIIDKIISDRKNKDYKDKIASEDVSDADDSKCGKEDFVYVDGKAGYKREGRVSFGQRGR